MKIQKKFKYYKYPRVYSCNEHRISLMELKGCSKRYFIYSCTSLTNKGNISTHFRRPYLTIYIEGHYCQFRTSN